MRIFVDAKPRARVEKIERVSENQLRVWVKEPPEDGRANEAILRAVAEYFHVPFSSVHLLSGHTARKKLVEIQE